MRLDFNEDKVLKNGVFYNISLEIPTIIGFIDDVYLNIDNRKVKLSFSEVRDNMAIFKGCFSLSTKALYHYYFDLKINGYNRFIDKDLNIVTSMSDKDMFKLSVNFKNPEWVKGAIMYHIFVDRFYRGSKSKIIPFKNRTVHDYFSEDVVLGPNQNNDWNVDFYGGDLKGIIDKLDYIKSLGVNILYLSPICYSQSNHRYDTSDYEMVDPYAGTTDDLKLLCDKAHKMGMKVVLDAVFNHTGNDSKYFNEFNNFDGLGAFNSNSSKYYDFYRKHEENGTPIFDYWWGFKNLPVCDGESKSWQNYICGVDGVIDQWFKCGIDGLRLDVADELTDNYIELIRSACKRNKDDSFILGEVWENPMKMGRGYLSSGNGMDSVMNYQLVDALIRYFKYDDIHKLRRIINEILVNYPEDTIYSLMNFTSTHDISRAIDIFGSDEFDKNSKWAWNLKSEDLKHIKDFLLANEQYLKGKNVYEAYLFLLNFFPGILSYFYGDEVGLQGLGNLQNRRPYPWGREDTELLQYVRWLGQIRNKEEFLRDAKLNMLDINSDYMLFERLSDTDKMLVAVNKTDKNVEYNVPNGYSSYDRVYSLKKSMPGSLSAFGGIAIKK